MGGATVKDVAAPDFIKAYAAYLKRSGRLEVPKWSDVVKTGKGKELGPQDADWYYVRAASVARQVYLRTGHGVGVGALKVYYGNRKNRGNRPSHHVDGSGSVARNVLKGLEKIKVVEKDEKGGRRISQQGQRELDRISTEVLNKQKAALAAAAAAAAQ
jgi:small subunit ribosomal protein S19e